MVLVILINLKLFFIKQKFKNKSFFFTKVQKKKKLIEIYTFFPLLLKQVNKVEKEANVQLLSHFDTHEIIQGLNSFKASKALNCNFLTTPVDWQSYRFGDTVFFRDNIPIHTIEYKMCMSPNYFTPLNRSKFFNHHFGYPRTSQIEIGFSSGNKDIKMGMYPYDTLDIPYNRFRAVDYSNFYSSHFKVDEAALNRLLESYYTDHLASQHMVNPIFEKLIKNMENEQFVFDPEIGGIPAINHLEDILINIPL